MWLVSVYLSEMMILFIASLMAYPYMMTDFSLSETMNGFCMRKQASCIVFNLLR